MKELSIEQKAKAYDEALARANEMIKAMTNIGGVAKVDDIQHIFPELKESEDERVRKALINGFNKLDKSAVWYNGITNAQILAWLKKQGEQKPQGKSALEASKEEKVDNANKVEPKDYSSIDPHFFKPADKVEPKFKVGDWIIGRATNNEPRQISEITDNYYKSTYGGQYGFSFEDEMHLWTIQDAKDGDVLAWDYSKCIALFKNIYDEYSFRSCGFVGHCTGIFESKQGYHDIEGAHPATKEQRDQLEKAMVNAGYKWNKKERKLEKIKQDPWGEKNSSYYDDICEILINLLHNETANVNKDAVQKDLDWLKSLRPQNKWKPSDEQMETLEHFVRSVGESGYASPYDNNTKLLYSLLSDLKKLKG